MSQCERTACQKPCGNVSFHIWNNPGHWPPFRKYCAKCGMKIMQANQSEAIKLRCELSVPMVDNGTTVWSSYRKLVELYRRYATAEQVDHYNIWFDYAEVLPTITAIQEGKWEWPANSQCKYVNLRIDTRGLKVRLSDQNGRTITPAQFAYQNPSWQHCEVSNEGV